MEEVKNYLSSVGISTENLTDFFILNELVKYASANFKNKKIAPMGLEAEKFIVSSFVSLPNNRIDICGIQFHHPNKAITKTITATELVELLEDGGTETEDSMYFFVK